jgi:hypothetical protein
VVSHTTRRTHAHTHTNSPHTHTHTPTHRTRHAPASQQLLPVLKKTAQKSKVPSRVVVLSSAAHFSPYRASKGGPVRLGAIDSPDGYDPWQAYVSVRVCVCVSSLVVLGCSCGAVVRFSWAACGSAACTRQRGLRRLPGPLAPCGCQAVRAVASEPAPVTHTPCAHIDSPSPTLAHTHTHTHTH